MQKHWSCCKSMWMTSLFFLLFVDLGFRLSEKSTDVEDKLRPSISYLQKLGPEYLDQIFKYSRWIFDQDADMAFEVCHCMALSNEPRSFMNTVDIPLRRCRTATSSRRELP